MCNALRMTPPDLIGSAEAAHHLGVDKSTLTRWVADGRITVAVRASGKPNSAMLFLSADIERLRSARGEIQQASA